MSAPPRCSEPWDWRHLWVLGLGQAFAASLLLGAWVGASAEVRPADQTGWLDVGIVAAASAGVVNGSFLLRGRRAVARRRRAIFAAHESPSRHSPPPPGGTALDAALVSADAMTRYHRPNCLLVAGKRVAAMSRSDHEEGRRRPCGVCQP